jgi:hypothetical protein
MGGIRCSNCGAQPGVPVVSVSDLHALPPSAAQPARYVAVPMQVGPKAPAPGRPRKPIGMLARSTFATFGRSSNQLVARLRRWAAELPEPTLRTWITTAAAGIAIALAIAVVITLG